MFSNSKKTLRLVQFNVENLFLFIDLYKDQDLKKITEAEWKSLCSSSTPNKPLRKLWALTSIIQELNPDILMLNEVGGPESLENFNRYFLNSEFKPYLKEGNSHRGIDVGYLVRKSLDHKAVHISHKNRPLNFLYPHETQTQAGGKSHYFSRDVSELRLFKPEDNSPRLVILLCHLKSKLDSDGIDSSGRLRRAAEVNCLVEIYNEIKEELGPQVPIIVAGDFNGIASRQDTEQEFLTLYEKSDLIDVFEVANKPLAERFTQVQILPSGKQSFVQIDYIFGSPALHKQILPEETFVFRFKDSNGYPSPIPRNLEERSAQASDHYPVVLTLLSPQD